ncbi:hypothetical protein [Neisseria sp. GT4A_CT1]|jgi:hypothetical protein|uniref:hypothetical protein n=1 Tax=Neisseria sp. GT4A_CT1 TaxID=665946 RepID=UPI00022BFA57|nr:hypothetical protein [Neisseria sp. GT4A_CT1]EGY59683.1 hypothetical protein HMPREF1028_01747 [Neisseria sp. GT4A_CT1]
MDLNNLSLNITIQDVAAIVAIISGIFAVIRVANGFVSNNFFSVSKKRLEYYEFSKKFLDEIKKEKNGDVVYKHPFLIEKGFYVLSGKENLSATEILYCLEQKNPTLFLNHYPSVRGKYLKYSISENLIIFKGRYRELKRRNYVRNINKFMIVFYGFMLFFLIFNILNDKFLVKFGWNWWQVGFVLSSIVIVVIAAIATFMNDLIKIGLAEEMVIAQKNNMERLAQQTTDQNDSSE